MQEEGRIINSYLDIEISELFDGEDKIVFEGYQYLKRLDFSKCDFLPDEVLEIMKLFRKGAEFLNYYSYPIKFIFDWIKKK